MNELYEIVSRLATPISKLSFDVVEARKEIGADGVSCWALKVVAQKTPEQLEAENEGADDADNE